MTSSALNSYCPESERAFSWSTLLSLTHEMLDAAEAGEWGRVLHLAPNRRQQIEHFFSSGIAPDEAELVRNGIIEILDSDQELLRLSRGYEHKRPANVIQFRRPASSQRS